MITSTFHQYLNKCLINTQSTPTQHTNTLTYQKLSLTTLLMSLLSFALFSPTLYCSKKSTILKPTKSLFQYKLILTWLKSLKYFGLNQEKK